MNPFELLSVPAQFDLPDLDIHYFKAYKAAQNKEEVNQAYAILNNKIHRAQALCKVYEQDKKDNSLAKEMLQLVGAEKNVLQQTLEEAESAIFENAMQGDWAKTWHYCQKYNYLMRLLGMV